MAESRSGRGGLRITWVLPTANMAGGVKSHLRIAEAMADRGHSATLLYVAPSVARPWPSPWRVRTFARRLVREALLAGRMPHHLASDRVDLREVRHVPIRAGDAPDADIVLGTWWETMEWMRGWPASKGTQLHFVRGHEVYGRHAERVRAVYRMPAPKLVISTWLARVMEDEYNAEVAGLIPNGYDKDIFRVPPRDLGDPPTVGMLYGVTPWKGAEAGFEAMRLARRTAPELRLASFGAYPLERRHGAPEGLEYLLRPEPRALAAFYGECDCWLTPSTTEGFGMPGLEAAACGCPLVSTRCGGPEDYVREGENGFLVDVGDVDAMAERILTIVLAPPEKWRAMSDASVRIAEQFDWARSAELLEAALFRTLGRREAAA